MIPVGEAFMRAIQAGVADPNPYDGIEPGKIDLWTNGSLSREHLRLLPRGADGVRRCDDRDPRSLGDNECSAFELGMAARDARALQQVAFDQLTSGGGATLSMSQPKTGGPARCSR